MVRAVSHFSLCLTTPSSWSVDCSIRRNETSVVGLDQQPINLVSKIMVSRLNLVLYTLHFSSGISGKSQVLFAMVFTTRYLDLVLNFISIYNTVMKIIFLVTAYGTLYLMFIKFRATYDSNHDTFRAEFLVIPAVGLALLVNHEFSVLEVRKCSMVTLYQITG